MGDLGKQLYIHSILYQLITNKFNCSDGLQLILTFTSLFFIEPKSCSKLCKVLIYEVSAYSDGTQTISINDTIALIL